MRSAIYIINFDLFHLYCKLKIAIRRKKQQCIKENTMKEKAVKVAIVTGASSGIGLATARALLKRGYTVYGVSRRGCKGEDFRSLRCDVTVREAVTACVARVIAETGRIDLLVNSAGMGISGSAENTPTDSTEEIFRVNVLGVAEMCRAVLPTMRAQGCGRIVNLGSVAGELPIPFQTFYSATKSAIGSYSRALAMEVKPYGVKVVCVLPGDTRTGFTAARVKNPADDACYGERIARSVGRMEHDETHGMRAESVARVVVRAAVRKNPPPTVTAGISYRFLLALAKFLPRRLVDKILYNMYAK